MSPKRIARRYTSTSSVASPPPSIRTTPYDVAHMKPTMATADTSAGFRRGRVTETNARLRDAPRLRAAATNIGSMVAHTGATVRITTATLK